MLRGCGCHGSGGRGLIGRLLAYKQVIGGMVEKMPENKKIGSGVGVGGDALAARCLEKKELVWMQGSRQRIRKQERASGKWVICLRWSLLLFV